MEFAVADMSSANASFIVVILFFCFSAMSLTQNKYAYKKF